MCHICIIYVHICYRISEHTCSSPIYAVTYTNIRQYICAEKVNIYLPCDIYVSIYVDIYGLKKSTCICLMSYMLLYNVLLPIHVVTHIDLYECQLSMCEHICAQKSICYHICEHILAEKTTYILYCVICVIV